MTLGNDVEQVLASSLAGLQTRLQDALEAYGPEDKNDAWQLLNALLGKDGVTEQELIAHFDECGSQTAHQGEKLDKRLNGLQQQGDVLAQELRTALQEQPSALVDVCMVLSHLQSQAAAALARGYQRVVEELTVERIYMSQQIAHRLTTLQRINGVSNSAIDLDQTLEITAQEIATELHAELCSIFFYDELQRVLTLRATNGPHPLGGMHFTLRLGEGYSGWVADKGRPLVTSDALADPNYASEARSYHTDFRGLMAIPIIFFGNDERLIGVISVQSEEIREFSRDEVSFVEVVAGIVAINIENGRLYEQTDEQLRRKVHELATIHRVSSIIASTLNLDEVLQIITTQAVHLSGAERSCLFELDQDRQKLQVLAHYGFDTNLASRIRIGVGQCCAGRCVQTGRPSMAVDCFQSDESCFLHDDPFVTADIHSVLCVPLKVKQKVLGCICIYSSHRHLLSPEQMQLVITFANEAAIAIENARLYEEARRGSELKSVLLRELNHRVKNNLATVAGILSLQRRRTKSPEIQATLAESVNRVQGLASTHDLLAHEDVSEARVDEIARKIVGVAHSNLCPPEKHITFQVESIPIVIPSKSVTMLALVINEMISNAIKHGLKNQNEGTIIVYGREEDNMVYVQVIDDGKEGPAFELSFDETAEKSSEGLGLSLIKNLIGDLHGKFSLRREKIVLPNQPGTEPVERTIAEVCFPLVPYKVPAWSA